MDFDRRRDGLRYNRVLCSCSDGVCTGIKSTVQAGLNSELHVKPSQVAVASSSPSDTPSRAKHTYYLELKDLSYKIIRKPKNPKGTWETIKAELATLNAKPSHYVLKHVCCEAKPGEVMAVAGPSGAGKSTLLEVLAGRIKPGSGSGSILVNGQPMDMQHFRRISGYVMQDDALFPMLTVKETLMYSARLRLPRVVPMKEKAARVDALMAELGLGHVAATRVGNEQGHGLSGGERRRVSIGVDVIHDPAVLILDEPTSGLDSAAALHVCSMLRTMAVGHNRTIILSIHQPGYRLLQMFHSILLLAHGAVVHHGTLELLSQKLLATGQEIPPQVNVLEYAIDSIDSLDADRSSIFSIRGKDSSSLPVLSLHELFELDPARALLESQPSLPDSTTSAASSDSDNVKVHFANSSVTEIMILARRFTQNVIRTKQLLIARTVQSLGAGCGLGTIYLHMGYGTPGMQKRVGFLAFTLTFLLTSSIEVLPIFLEERTILKRETGRGAYRVSSYVLSSTLVFLPFLFLIAVMYAAPVYFLVGLAADAGAFFFFLLTLWLVLVSANSFVSFFSALVSNFIMGNTWVTGIMGAFFLFSGYFIAKEYMPNYWLFLHYLSLFKYPLNALLINEYTHVPDRCFGPVYDGRCFVTGENVLENMSLDHENKWVNVGIMAAFAVAYRLMCFAVLHYKLVKRHR
jgi:ABC-type multidrug transport system ATPase subunit